jgi:hypothetical protein
MQTESLGQDQNQEQQQEITLEELQAENLRLKKEALLRENESLKSNSGSGVDLASILHKAITVNSPDHKIQAHGRTVGEFKLLKEIQARGERLPHVMASDGKSQIREDEQHLVHVFLETVLYNEKGKKVSPPGRLMKFDANDFSRMTQGDRNHFGQYDIIQIIHDPRVKSGTKPAENKKPATEQTIEEMKETYRLLYGEEPEESMPVATMILRIREAQA